MPSSCLIFQSPDLVHVLTFKSSDLTDLPSFFNSHSMYLKGYSNIIMLIKKVTKSMISNRIE